MSELHELLKIEEESIESVAETMKNLRTFLEKEGKTSMLSFLDAYLKITEQVILEKQKGNFDQPERLTKLDIRFAELYFCAVKKYLEEGEKIRPWETYFNYIERGDSKPVLELLLGINAHINADLTQVLREQNYDNIEDFRKINSILRRSIYPIMAKIALERRNVECLGLMSLPPVTWTALKKIKTWRELSLQNSRDNDFNLEILRERTEENAENLIDLRHNYAPNAVFRKPFKALKIRV